MYTICASSSMFFFLNSCVVVGFRFEKVRNNPWYTDQAVPMPGVWLCLPYAAGNPGLMSHFLMFFVVFPSSL